MYISDSCSQEFKTLSYMKNGTSLFPKHWFLPKVSFLPGIYATKNAQSPPNAGISLLQWKSKFPDYHTRQE